LVAQEKECDQLVVCHDDIRFVPHRFCTEGVEVCDTCVAISRECIEAVGYFDTCGCGNGNYDYAERASAYGFKCVRFNPPAQKAGRRRVSQPVAESSKPKRYALETPYRAFSLKTPPIFGVDGMGLSSRLCGHVKTALS